MRSEHLSCCAGGLSGIAQLSGPQAAHRITTSPSRAARSFPWPLQTKSGGTRISSGPPSSTSLVSKSGGHSCRRWNRHTLRPIKVGTLYDAHGHNDRGPRNETSVHEARSQKVRVWVRVANVRSPILSIAKLVKQGHQFEAGLTVCNMSKRG